MVDFAYHVHTDVGNTMVGVKVSFCLVMHYCLHVPTSVFRHVVNVVNLDLARLLLVQC